MLFDFTEDNIKTSDESSLVGKSLKMSDEDYFAQTDFISNSDFRLLNESPLHLDNKELFKLESNSINLGSMVHKLVLESDDFNNVYAIEEFEGCDLNKNSKAYKDARDEFLEDNQDKIIVTSDEFKKATKMARNVNAIAGNFLKNGVAEQAFFSQLNDVKTKCKADYYREDLGLVIDLKTTKSIKDFRKSVLEYGYFTQAPFYIDNVASLGFRATRFLFILVETINPFMVSVQEIDLESVEEGRAVYQKNIQIWKDYKENNVCEVVKTTGLPTWYLDKIKGN